MSENNEGEGNNNNKLLLESLTATLKGMMREQAEQLNVKLDALRHELYEKSKHKNKPRRVRSSELKETPSYMSKSSNKRLEKQQRSIDIVSQWLDSQNHLVKEVDQKEGAKDKVYLKKDPTSLALVQTENLVISSPTISTFHCANTCTQNVSTAKTIEQVSDHEKEELVLVPAVQVINIVEEAEASPRKLELDSKPSAQEEKAIQRRLEYVDFIFGDSTPWGSKNNNKTWLLEVLNSNPRENADFHKPFKKNKHKDFGGQGHNHSISFLSNKETIYLDCFLFSRNYKLQPWIGVINQQPWKGLIASCLIKEYQADASWLTKPPPHRDKFITLQKRDETNLLSFGTGYNIMRIELKQGGCNRQDMRPMPKPQDPKVNRLAIGELRSKLNLKASNQTWNTLLTQQGILQVLFQLKISLELTGTTTQTQSAMNLSYMDFSILRQLQTFIWRPGDFLKPIEDSFEEISQVLYLLAHIKSGDGFGPPILQAKAKPAVWPTQNQPSLVRPEPAPPWIIKTSFPWCPIAKRSIQNITPPAEQFICLILIFISLFKDFYFTNFWIVCSLMHGFIWKPGEALRSSLKEKEEHQNQELTLLQNFIWKPGDIFGIFKDLNEFQGSTLRHSSTKPGSF